MRSKDHLKVNKEATYAETPGFGRLEKKRAEAQDRYYSCGNGKGQDAPRCSLAGQVRAPLPVLLPRQGAAPDCSGNKGPWAADSQHARETSLPDGSPLSLHRLIRSEEINPDRASFHMSSRPHLSSTGTRSNTLPFYLLKQECFS